MHEVKNILIVSSAFFPENSPRAFRATELAKELSTQGHNVTVITLNHGQAAIDLCLRYKITLKFLGALRLRPVPTKNFLSKILRRVLMILLEYPEVELAFKVKKALRNERDYDLLISVAAPHPVHWGVAFARTPQRGIANVWAADCGDPFMGNQSDSLKRLFYFGFLERFTFRKADFIAIPIEEARSAYYKEFHRKIVIIPQGINFNEFTNALPSYKPNSPITFAYAGSFIPGKRDPRMFLDFLMSQDIDFRFVIFTNMQGLISEYADKASGRIVLKDYIPREQLIRTLSTMDFLVNFENSTSTQAPSKLIDYYLSGRPVLSVSSSEVDAHLVTRFLHRDFLGAVQMMGYDRFRIETVAKSFLDLLSLTK